MIAEETRLIVDEMGVTRRIPAGRPIPAQWEKAYEEGETINEPDTKAQAGPEVDMAQKEADTTKDNPVTQAAASRRRK